MAKPASRSTLTVVPSSSQGTTSPSLPQQPNMTQFYTPQSGADLFTLPASDAKGESVNLSVKMPPMYAGIIDKILRSENKPFKSKSYLLRYAIAVTLQHFSRGDVELESLSVQLNVINGIQQEADFQLEFIKMFENISETVTKMKRHRMEGEAMGYLLKIRRGLEDMPDTALKDRYLHEFDLLFGDMILGAKSPEY